MLVVARSPGILAGSVLDAVADCGPHRACDDRAREALRAAQLPADELSAGYGTVVTGGAPELSGGQRGQRIVLARALCAEPEILVLEDPTSALDPLTEHRTAEALRFVQSRSDDDRPDGRAGVPCGRRPGGRTWSG